MDRRTSWAVRAREERERGQATIEYIGVFVLTSLLVVGLIAMIPSARAQMKCIAGQVTGPITGGNGRSSCSGGGVAKPPTIPTTPPPPVIDWGLETNVAGTLQSTERGRATLQWLLDRNIPLVVTGPGTGVRWDAARNRLLVGSDFGDAAALIRELNHVQYLKDGRHANVWGLDRDGYIKGIINEEVDGVVQAIQAAHEFRAAGRDSPPQLGEAVYDAAYNKAIAEGASDLDARKAATAAIEKEYYDGGIATSYSGKSFPEYYGDYWDSMHGQ
ncbi:MAG: hypothetical protein FWD11_02340 [Micrococcales bacterium]|nr:hypothetical protein [Micrococcales bacterium]